MLDFSDVIYVCGGFVWEDVFRCDWCCFVRVLSVCSCVQRRNNYGFFILHVSFFRIFAFENINRILKLNKMDKKTKFILGAVVAVVVLVIGFLLYSMREQMLKASRCWNL